MSQNRLECFLKNRIRCATCGKCGTAPDTLVPAIVDTGGYEPIFYALNDFTHTYDDALFTRCIPEEIRHQVLEQYSDEVLQQMADAGVSPLPECAEGETCFAYAVGDDPWFGYCSKKEQKYNEYIVTNTSCAAWIGAKDHCSHVQNICGAPTLQFCDTCVDSDALTQEHTAGVAKCGWGRSNNTRDGCYLGTELGPFILKEEETDKICEYHIKNQYSWRDMCQELGHCREFSSAPQIEQACDVSERTADGSVTTENSGV